MKGLTHFRTTFDTLVCSGFLGALLIGSTQPVCADDHLPILEITPTLGWSLTSNGGNPPITSSNPAAEDGLFTFNGTATLPIIKNLSVSYDRIGNGSFDSLLSSFYVPGVPLGKNNPVYPGGNIDLLQNYRADYRLGHFTIEGGFGSRYRQCCPADSLEWHKAFVGVSYVTPHVDILNKGFFVVALTGNGTNHQSTAYYRALLDSPPPVGLGPNADLPNGHIFTTDQSVTAVIPVNRPYNIHTATTFLWGALDYPEHGPFPQYYHAFIFSATKQVNKDFGIIAEVSHVQQRVQGYPFPAPNSINTSAITLSADFHLDFNKMFTPPARSTQPGVPGGPGGPIPVVPPSPTP
jgi:hypothetical protein